MTKLEKKSQNTNRTLLRLEDKLIELGYKKLDWSRIYYVKQIKEFIEINIVVSYNCKKIENYYIDATIENEEDYKAVDQAFKRMNKDLEVLRQCQD